MFQLAQVNIGRTKAPLDSPLLADFMAALDPVNARADAAPGFVWRLQDEAGNATSLRVFDDETLVNMSVWESPEALRDWVYGDPEHLAALRRRREWFEKVEMFMCLWWVPAGHVPTVHEAEERLTHLRAHGPTAHAFSFQVLYPPPGVFPDMPRLDGRNLCPA
jgi:heme-degrading monooxygenase HmoA